MNGYGGLYHRIPRLIEDIQVSRGDGPYIKLLKSLSRIEVLVLDDWGLVRLTPPQQRDLLELLDDRHTGKSTIVTSQLPINHWHEAMADPTLADATSTVPDGRVQSFQAADFVGIRTLGVPYARSVRQRQQVRVATSISSNPTQPPLLFHRTSFSHGHRLPALEPTRFP